MITLLDYGAGNVRSVINAVEKLGERITVATTGRDILDAEKLVFPGVGNFGSMMRILQAKAIRRAARGLPGLRAPVPRDLRGDAGPCSRAATKRRKREGLGILPGRVKRFDVALAVPHIGWNGISAQQPTDLFYGLDRATRNSTLCTPTTSVADDPAVGAHHHRLRIPVCQRESKRTASRPPSSIRKKAGLPA